MSKEEVLFKSLLYGNYDLRKLNTLINNAINREPVTQEILSQLSNEKIVKFYLYGTDTIAMTLSSSEIRVYGKGLFGMKEKTTFTGVVLDIGCSKIIEHPTDNPYNHHVHCKTGVYKNLAIRAYSPLFNSPRLEVKINIPLENDLSDKGFKEGRALCNVYIGDEYTFKPRIFLCWLKYDSSYLEK